MQEFFERARKILAEQLDIKMEKIQMETTFDEIEADSIDIVEMIMALEDIYDVEFPEEEQKDYQTVGSLINDLYEFLRQSKNAK
ncbi:MAG: acyl carrier protein [Syntrophomonas sp.]|uniref:acyl carrier protein n=1 Tax=Syntrophomonas sp. TaxID=2053627 RepID=UPI00261D9D8E|nr:acyl carrier protein [Syntrophomonas sp.]MDD2510118.1 acyl carrier protein [Syntrophomonas sp.]MDD3878521.1 acyl carrier protein [Syntrophomonas sp.]MDD4626432.1 acyl carrier protein [Syntrophomonas sp.]